MAPIKAPEGTSPTQLAQNEAFWQKVAAQFNTDPSFINLENGYYGIMPEPIYQNYLRNTLRLNRQNSYLLRKTYHQEEGYARAQLAAALGVASDEIALTRGGTEALQNLIAGYNKLQPGDQVLYADLDYYSCQFAVQWLVDRRMVSLVKINMPEPAERQAVINAYAQALDDNPGIKLVLLTHLNNRTGLVLPVAEIADIARERGADVIVDCAHSWGQLDFKVEDLRADFVGLSLHKWIHAPLGLGCLYIRQGRTQDIDPCYGDGLYDSSDTRSRVHSGTKNVAPYLTLPSALEFHRSLGARAKQERLQYLRNYWVTRVQQHEAVQILTPNDPSMYGAITSFRIRGRGSKEDNARIVEYLFEKHHIFTVGKGGSPYGDCVRVTPALFTSLEHVNRLAQGIEDVVKKFAVPS